MHFNITQIYVNCTYCDIELINSPSSQIMEKRAPNCLKHEAEHPINHNTLHVFYCEGTLIQPDEQNTSDINTIAPSNLFSDQCGHRNATTESLRPAVIWPWSRSPPAGVRGSFGESFLHLLQQETCHSFYPHVVGLVYSPNPSESCSHRRYLTYLKLDFHFIGALL